MTPKIHLRHDARAGPEVEHRQAALIQVVQDSLAEQLIVPAMLKRGIKLAVKPVDDAAHQSPNPARANKASLSCWVG